MIMELEEIKRYCALHPEIQALVMPRSGLETKIRLALKSCMISGAKNRLRRFKKPEAG